MKKHNEILTIFIVLLFGKRDYKFFYIKILKNFYFTYFNISTILKRRKGSKEMEKIYVLILFYIL